MINAQTSDAEGEAPLEMTMDEKEKEVTVEQEGNLQTGVRKSKCNSNNTLLIDDSNVFNQY